MHTMSIRAATPASAVRHVLRATLGVLLWTTALPAQRPVSASTPTSTFAASDLAGLRLRNIGPASMSGRVVDMDVVESNPYTMYVAGATGGIWRTHDNG